MKISSLSAVVAVTDTQVFPVVDSGVTKKATVAQLQSFLGVVSGALQFRGIWNATTNIPALASGVGVAGYSYVVGTAGGTTIDGLTSWRAGDWAIFDGTVWRKLSTADTIVVSGLSDVVITGVSNGDMLVYDAVTSKWVNMKQIAVVSAAGTIQSTATAITARVNIVTVVAATHGVRLVYDGTSKRAVNRGANEMRVYPQSGASIEGQATNMYVTVPSGGETEFFPTTSTTWIAS